MIGGNIFGRAFCLSLLARIWAARGGLSEYPRKRHRREPVPHAEDFYLARAGPAKGLSAGSKGRANRGLPIVGS